MYMDTDSPAKKSHSSAAVTAAVIVLCVAVLGGGFFMWKKKSREQVEELQRQLEGIQNNEESGLQDQPAGLGEEAPTPELLSVAKCFSSGVESVATVPDSTWYLNRNMHTGYQYKIAESMTMSRDAAREEGGIEAFTIASKEYSKGALLDAYDIKKMGYIYESDEKITIRNNAFPKTSIYYDKTSDLWHVMKLPASASSHLVCAPDEFMKTAGKLPVYVIDSASGMRTYLVLAKIDAAKADTPAFLLEISLNTKDPNLPSNFLKNLEGLIQSIDRIGGQYPF